MLYLKQRPQNEFLKSLPLLWALNTQCLPQTVSVLLLCPVPELRTLTPALSQSAKPEEVHTEVTSSKDQDIS